MESFQTEMLRTMEELSVKRQTLDEEVHNDEVYMQVLTKELKLLHEKQKNLQNRVHLRTEAQKEYEKTLEEAASAVKKVQEASAALMNVMRT